MSAAAPSHGAALDRHERLLWTIMRSFEDLALRRYEAQALEALATTRKNELCRALREVAPDDAALDGSALEEHVRGMLAVASADDPLGTCLLQGILLEHLGAHIYEAIAAQKERASEGSSAIARLGTAAARESADAALEQLSASGLDGAALFDRFVEVSREPLRRLDALGEAVDDAFSERFDISFADIMGGVTAEVLPACLELGMARRKVVCHLTGSLMGL